MELKNILQRIESRLDDLTKSFHQFKTENEILRKEILGVSSHQNSESVGLMEARTLREIVEETEFYTKRINLSFLSKETELEKPKKSKPRRKVKTNEAVESDSESSKDSAEKFPVAEIRSKTLADEREILKETFYKLIKEQIIRDGESLQGTSVQTISNSKPGLSCTIKLSNCLDTALTDLQSFYTNPSIIGPSRVVGNFSEVFSIVHQSYYHCLWSFTISKVLRLTMYCHCFSNGYILFGIGFTPADVPVNPALLNTLNRMPPTTDVWMMNKQYSKIPLELFVTQGNLLVRGHMNNGPRSIIHVEILEVKDISGPISAIGVENHITDGKSIEFNQSTNKDGTISRSVGKSGRFSCSVEIVNCLNVPLRNRNKFYSNSNDKDFWPLEIPSFHRESFLGSSDSNFEGMFSYEILSTDLALVIALKVGPGSNSFAPAFSQIPAVTEKKDLEELMNPSQWKIHDYKKCFNASKTFEVIRDRNIRAEILMTEEEKSILKIRIYAV